MRAPAAAVICAALGSTLAAPLIDVASPGARSGAWDFSRALSASARILSKRKVEPVAVIGVVAFIGGSIGCVLFFWACIRLGAWAGRREVRRFEAAQVEARPPTPRPPSTQEITWPVERPPPPVEEPSELMRAVLGQHVLERRRSAAGLDHLRPGNTADTDAISLDSFRPASPVRSESNIPAPAPAYEPPPAYAPPP